MERNGFNSERSRDQAFPRSLPNFLCSMGVFHFHIIPGRLRHPSLKVVQTFWIVLVFSMKRVSKYGWGVGMVTRDREAASGHVSSIWSGLGEYLGGWVGLALGGAGALGWERS